MNHHLRLEMNDVEGALMRSVGVAQRRGFAIASAHFERLESGKARLELAVESANRTVEVLMRQLLRLHEVTHVEQFEIKADLKIAEVH